MGAHTTYDLRQPSGYLNIIIFISHCAERKELVYLVTRLVSRVLGVLSTFGPKLCDS